MHAVCISFLYHLEWNRLQDELRMTHETNTVVYLHTEIQAKFRKHTLHIVKHKEPALSSGFSKCFDMASAKQSAILNWNVACNWFCWYGQQRL